MILRTAGRHVFLVFLETHWALRLNKINDMADQGLIARRPGSCEQG